MANVRGKKRLSTTIFAAVLTFVLVVVSAAVSIVTYIYYLSYEEATFNNLTELAESAAAKLDVYDSDQRVNILQLQIPNTIRCTLVDTDGTILYDSMYGTSNDTADILSRPEVQEALNNGQSSIIRYSETLADDTFYSAVRLTDGQVVRLARTSSSVRSLFCSLIPSVACILIAVVLLSLLVALALTRLIMRPFDENHGEIKPVEDVVYAEMVPFMSRLTEQQNRLKKQNEQLMLAEDLRRDFTAGVQHEMKTPLQVVSGYSELLKNDCVEQADVTRFANIIYDETQNMRALIDDVLVLSRLDQPIWKDSENDPDEDVDLLVLARQADKHLTPLAESKGTTLEVHGESAIVHGNEALLWQIISNLTSNAIRYSGAGAHVELYVSTQTDINSVTSTVNAADAAEAALVMVPPRSHALIRVKDNGIGINSAEVDKIFQRFYRVEKSHSKDNGGTGLGLAIVKHAADYHNAQIKVESEPGLGSIFTVIF
jgi:two-component system phosphate regulon sensor histidine kinase PhoR